MLFLLLLSWTGNSFFILSYAYYLSRDRVTKPTAQIGFIKYVLLPLFEALNKVRIIILVQIKKEV